MNEIPIEKQFRQVSHAGEANQYARVTVPLPRRQYRPYDSGAGQIADGLGAFAKGATDLLGVIAEKKQESEKIADEVELTKLNNLVRQRLATISVTNDRELREGAQAFRDELAYQIANNENLSDRGRQQANLLLETAVGGYNAKGAAEIFRFRENQRKAQAADSLNQAVAAGDLPGALNWFDRSLELGVTPKASRETVESMTFRNNLVNGYLSKLGIGALREEQKKLDEINPDGSFKEFPMIKAPEAAELQGWIRNRINIMTNTGQDTLDEMTAKGTLTPESLRELHEQGEISPAQWRAGLARIEKNRQATEQIISAARKERIQQTSNRISREMFEAYDQLGTASPQRLAAFKARFNEAITKAEAEGKLDDSHITALKKTLREYSSDISRADGGIKSSDNYQAGLRYIEQMKLEGKLMVSDAGKKQKEGAAAFVEDSLKRALYDACKANPGATAEQLQLFLSSSAASFQQTEIGKLAETAFNVGNYAKSKDNVLIPRRVVRYGTVDGRKVAEYTDGTISFVD
ncbi:hypothetical protein [Victivallis vadensis]|uniref:hypothetical protein n=1 Tax=Victivallis vadensis TaxID=172901 RepID=UPI003AF54A9F